MGVPCLQYCCSKKCAVLDKSKRKDFTCYLCEDFVDCMCNCREYRELLMRYCCYKKCFDKFTTPLLDEPCWRCESFDVCHCDCEVRMKFVNMQFCCSERCSVMRDDRNCKLCPPGTRCSCLCEKTRTKSLEDGADYVAMINGKTVRLEIRNNSEDETYCCKDKCVKTPNVLVRGMACDECEAVNFCKCECLNYVKHLHWFDQFRP